jgi:hypothetical protein
MPASVVRTFADHDAYRAALRARRVEGVVTARGNFHAELTLIDLDRLLMQRAEENLPRVLDIPIPLISRSLLADMKGSRRTAYIHCWYKRRQKVEVSDE